MHFTPRVRYIVQWPLLKEPHTTDISEAGSNNETAIREIKEAGCRSNGPIENVACRLFGVPPLNRPAKRSLTTASLKTKRCA